MKPEIAIVGAGYVGVPLAQVFVEAGRRTVLVDVVQARVDQLMRGESYIEDVPSQRLAELVGKRLVDATTDYDVLRDTDAIVPNLRPEQLALVPAGDLQVLMLEPHERAVVSRGNRPVCWLGAGQRSPQSDGNEEPPHRRHQSLIVASYIATAWRMRSMLHHSSVWCAICGSPGPSTMVGAPAYAFKRLAASVI